MFPSKNGGYFQFSENFVSSSNSIRDEIVDFEAKHNVEKCLSTAIADMHFSTGQINQHLQLGKMWAITTGELTTRLDVLSKKQLLD